MSLITVINKQHLGTDFTKPNSCWQRHSQSYKQATFMFKPVSNTVSKLFPNEIANIQ